MIVKNRAQLKAWIKNMSSKVKVNENIILQNYMLERLLERISVSDYKYKFILKGGMLITAIVGIDMRNTLDMDATIKGFDLEKDNLENILGDIFEIDFPMTGSQFFTSGNLPGKGGYRRASLGLRQFGRRHLR